MLHYYNVAPLQCCIITMLHYYNVALLQCCIIYNVALFCKDLGFHYTHAISFGDFVGYTSISRAHYGSLESLGVVLASKGLNLKKT